MINEYFKPTDGYEILEKQQRSQWVCYMFGTTDSNGLLWRPALGEEPNWFWRMMQYFVFGNRWVKEVQGEKTSV